MTKTSLFFRAATPCAIMLLFAARVGAQHGPAALRDIPVAVPSMSAAGDAAHHSHVAVFGGATTNLTADHTDPTLGIEYEYKPAAWHGKAGVGAFAELTFAEHTEKILGGGLVFHPMEGLRIFTGGGVMVAEHEDPVTNQLETETKALLRLGGGWDFHLGRLTLGPTVYYDVAKGHRALVYGVAVGTGF